MESLCWYPKQSFFACMAFLLSGTLLASIQWMYVSMPGPVMEVPVALVAIWSQNKQNTRIDRSLSKNQCMTERSFLKEAFAFFKSGRPQYFHDFGKWLGSKRVGRILKIVCEKANVYFPWLMHWSRNADQMSLPREMIWDEVAPPLVGMTTLKVLIVFMVKFVEVPEKSDTCVTGTPVTSLHP